MRFICILNEASRRFVNFYDVFFVTGYLGNSVAILRVINIHDSTHGRPGWRNPWYEARGDAKVAGKVLMIFKHVVHSFVLPAMTILSLYHCY